MRLLLDESLPRALKQLLSAHEVATVPEKGWAGRSGGEFLRLTVIVLAAQTTRLEDLEPLVPEVLPFGSTITRSVKKS